MAILRAGCGNGDAEGRRLREEGNTGATSSRPSEALR